MIEFIRNRAIEFHATFHDSEVILWARIQWIFLAVYTGMQTMDMSAFISDQKLLQLYIGVNAAMTEMLRRNREDWKQ
jgi:hypothetical protein